MPLVAAKIAIADQVTAYVCEDTQCDLPTDDPNVFPTQLAKIRKLRVAGEPLNE